MKKSLLVLCLSIGLFTNTARANCDMSVLAGSVFGVSLVATVGSIFGMAFSAPSSDSKTESSLVFSGSWVVFPYSVFFLVASGAVLVAPRICSMTGSRQKNEPVADPIVKQVSVSDEDSLTSVSRGDS